MLSDIICIVITTIAKKTTQEKVRMEMRLHAYTCYVRTMRLYVIFFPLLHFPNIIAMYLFPFIAINSSGNYKFRLQFSRESPELHPGFLMRLPHVTHLSCLSLHTATITSRFPKIAIRITTERNVSSTTFSTDLKPSLALEDTQTRRTERNS